MSLFADLFAVQRRVDDIAGERRPTLRSAAASAASGLPVVSGASLPAVPARGVANGAREHVFGTLVTSAYEALAREGGREAGVDPALVAAVTQTESGFDPRATSVTGAAGLMQLMPATASELGVADPYDPRENVRGGAAYLHSLLERFHGNVRLSVAAYNAGPGAVERYGGVPPYAETQAYVARVMDAYRARGG